MARLTTKDRKRIPKKDFALKSKVTTGKRGGRKTKGAYPIEDKKHARNALSRVSEFGTPAQKKKVRAEVHAKYPSIGKKGKKGKKRR